MTLTALPRRAGWRCGLLTPGLLTLGVLLGACGSLPAPGPAQSSAAASSSGNTGTSAVSRLIVTAALSGPVPTPGSVWVASASPSQVSVTAQSVPGLTIEVGAAVADSGGVRVPITVSGPGTSQPGQSASVRLSVRAGGPTRSVELPVLALQRLALPVTGYQASSLRAAGGKVYLLPPINAPDPQRHTVITVDAASGAAQAEALPLSDTEGLTSQAIAPDGTRYLLVQNVAGNWVGAAKPGAALKHLPLGTPGDTLNNLTRSADGRLWALQYRQDALLELDPLSGAQQSHPVQDNAEDLITSASGPLYFSRFYAAPAIIRFDPASQQTQAFPVGVSGKSYPRLLTSSGSLVWFMDAWSRKVGRLDTASGQVSDVNLPAGASIAALSAAPDGTLWAADLSRHALYRWLPGQLDAQAINVPGDGPRALGLDAASQLWFESGGALYHLSP